MATRYKHRAPRHKRALVGNASSRNGSMVHGIMIHTTESQDRMGTADDLDGVGSWFANPASQASSWIGVDGDANSRLWVPGSRKAWTMGHYTINAQTLNIELVGRASQPKRDFEERQLKHAAKWAAYAILNYNFVTIDPKHVRRSRLAPGPKFVQEGIGRHKDLTDVGVGSHTDPGPNFPMSDFIRFVQYYCDHGWTLETK